MFAEGRQENERWASLVVSSILAGACLLLALAGSSILPKPHVHFASMAILLSAIALIDQALKLLPLKEIRLASGMALGATAMLMLFWH